MIDRRSFLKSTFIAAAGLAIPLNTFPKQSIRNLKTSKGLDLLTVKGKVTSKGQPVKGAIISDGFSCVATDIKGQYEITTNRNNSFIFLSVPAGYKIPVGQDNLPDIYHSINTLMENKALNFDLEPDNNSSKHTIFLMADPQVIDEADLQRFINETIVDVNNFISSEKIENSFAVSCGDIVFDRPNLFDGYKAGITKLHTASFTVPGNHDIDRTANTDDYSTETFKKHFGPNYYSFNKGEFHYIVLDDVFWFGSNYMGYIDQEQLDWLSNDLSFIPKEKIVMLFMHIPPFNSAYKRSGDKQPGIRDFVNNKEALYEIIKGYKSYIITGHMHETEFVKDGENEIHVCGAACGAWWTDNICGDGTPNGYMVYTADGNKLTWQYKATGKPFDYQLKIYDQRNTDKKRILANIWAANENWKINLYADGKMLGEMKSVLDKDPLASEKFDGAELPKKHKWVDSYPTYHMYEFKTDVAAKEITVEAVTDQGKTFKETIR